MSAGAQSGEEADASGGETDDGAGPLLESATANMVRSKYRDAQSGYKNGQ